MRVKLLVVLTLAVPAVCQTLPPGVQKKASVGGITEYEFPNGLRVLLYPDPANPKVTVNMTVLVGSRHEGYGETGMAHLLEHMDFIETTDGRQIKNEIVAHGAAWNGTTSDDRTNYFETVTATDENLKWALGLEADRMVNVKITKQLLDTEMTVVRNEFERGENSPQRVLSERVASTAYLWHNYGKSTIGSREDIEKVPVERLAAFYKKYYQPDNAVLAIGGKLDETKTLQWVAETLGRIPRPTRKLDQTYTVEPAQDGERYVELRRVGEGQDVIMAYHAPAAGHPDAAALQVLAGVMSGGGGGRGGRGGGGGGNGRLTKALVDNKKAESASMRVEQLHDPGLLQVSATLSKDQSIDEVRKIIGETLKGIVSEPPTKEEVDRVKTRMARNLEQQLTDAQQVAMAMTTPVSQGDWRLMFLQHDRIQKVTPEDLVRVAKTYIKDSNLTVGVFIPDAAPDRAAVPECAGSGAAVHQLQEQHRGIARRGVRPHAGQHRKARGAIEAGQRHEGRDAAEEDGGRHGIGGDRTALRRRQIACGPQCGGAACRQPADERHRGTESPADSGRDASTLQTSELARCVPARSKLRAGGTTPDGAPGSTCVPCSAAADLRTGRRQPCLRPAPVSRSGCGRRGQGSWNCQCGFRRHLHQSHSQTQGTGHYRGRGPAASA